MWRVNDDVLNPPVDRLHAVLHDSTAVDRDDTVRVLQEAELVAAEQLRRVLPEVAVEPAPEPDLAVAATRVRGPGPRSGPSDEDVLVGALAASLAGVGDPEWPAEAQLPVAALDPAVWVRAVERLAAAGPGARVVPAELAASVLAEEGELGRGDDGLVAAAFGALLPTWRLLGVVDGADGLTDLGLWALPRALLLDWESTSNRPGVRSGLVEDVAATVLEVEEAAWRDDPSRWTADRSQSAVEAAAAGAETAVGQMRDAHWEDFLRRLYDDTAGTPHAAVPAFLLARRAEWLGDTSGQVAWLRAALAADPGKRDALYDAADLAGAHGEADPARELLVDAGAGGDDPELAIYRHFAGRAGDTTPLRERAGWLWAKVAAFVQRPPQRADVLAWASWVHGVPDAPVLSESRAAPAAVRDVVTDLAVFEGGLLDRFLAQLGPLLPADEVGLVEGWRASERSVFRVLEVRGASGRGGARLRDLHDNRVVDVDDAAGPARLVPGEVVLGRLLGAGDGWVLGLVLPVPGDRAAGLVAAVRDPLVDGLLRWLRELDG